MHTHPTQTSPIENHSLSVLVVGSGGREHSLVKACLQSPLVSKVCAAPGNGGIALEAFCHPVAADDIEGIVRLVQDQGINFVIVGPEVPLSLGLVDALQAIGVTAFGPNQQAAQLEASKAFTKAFLSRHAIPTASGETFTEVDTALAWLRQQPGRVVVKASGLAAGKGVILPETHAEAEQAVRSMIDGRLFGDSSGEIVIEEFMQGEEASIMVIVDRDRYVILPASQDHKRIGEGDTGPNTGGMGAYAPAPVVTPAIMQAVEERIIVPTLQGLKADGITYRGVLYVGIMITNQGPKVVEFNVRFGDPECQVLLPLLETDPVALLYACARGQLDPQAVQLRDASAVIVVHTAAGYPDTYQKGYPIRLPLSIPDNVSLIHAGTRQCDNHSVVTDGGRVLGVVAIADDLGSAVRNAYEVCPQVQFEGSYYRKDIAWRELSRSQSAP